MHLFIALINHSFPAVEDVNPLRSTGNGRGRGPRSISTKMTLTWNPSSSSKGVSGPKSHVAVARMRGCNKQNGTVLVSKAITAYISLTHIGKNSISWLKYENFRISPQSLTNGQCYHKKKQSCLEIRTGIFTTNKKQSRAGAANLTENKIKLIIQPQSGNRNSYGYNLKHYLFCSCFSQIEQEPHNITYEIITNYCGIHNKQIIIINQNA